MEKKIYRVIDGSYSLKIGVDDLEHIYGIDMAYQDFEMLATDCDLPVSFGGLGQRNNCIIRHIEDGYIVFIQRRFLHKIEICPCCGKIMD